MSTHVIESPAGIAPVFQEALRLFNLKQYLRVALYTSRPRSLPQNAFTHAWYEEIARALPEDDALGWKCYCKLHHGVAILRAENDEFRADYDAVVKPLSYEKKLVAMKHWPVTSLMSTEQLTKYADAVQADFFDKGVRLEVRQG